MNQHKIVIRAPNLFFFLFCCGGSLASDARDRFDGEILENNSVARAQWKLHYSVCGATTMTITNSEINIIYLVNLIYENKGNSEQWAPAGAAACIRNYNSTMCWRKCFKTVSFDFHTHTYTNELWLHRHRCINATNTMFLNKITNFEDKNQGIEYVVDGN